MIFSLFLQQPTIYIANNTIMLQNIQGQLQLSNNVSISLLNLSFNSQVQSSNYNYNTNLSQFSLNITCMQATNVSQCGYQQITDALLNSTNQTVNVSMNQSASSYNIPLQFAGSYYRNLNFTQIKANFTTDITYNYSQIDFTFTNASRALTSYCTQHNCFLSVGGVIFNVSIPSAIQMNQIITTSCNYENWINNQTSANYTSYINSLFKQNGSYIIFIFNDDFNSSISGPVLQVGQLPTTFSYLGTSMIVIIIIVVIIILVVVALILYKFLKKKDKDDIPVQPKILDSGWGNTKVYEDEDEAAKEAEKNADYGFNLKKDLQSNKFLNRSAKLNKIKRQQQLKIVIDGQQVNMTKLEMGLTSLKKMGKQLTSFVQDKIKDTSNKIKLSQTMKQSAKNSQIDVNALSKSQNITNTQLNQSIQLPQVIDPALGSQNQKLIVQSQRQKSQQEGMRSLRMKVQ